MKGIVHNKNDFNKFKSFQSEDVELIDSEKIEEIDFSAYQMLIIPAELEHFQYQHDDFYGFNLIRDLRLRYKITIPIVIYSILNKSFFLDNRSNLSFQVMKSPGHYFFEYNISTKEIFPKIFQMQFEGIDEDTLIDINNTFFTVEGVLDEEFHDLKNKAFKRNRNDESIEELFNELQNNVDDSFLKFQSIFDLSDNSILINIRNEMITDLKKSVDKNKNFDDCIVIIENYVGEVKRLLPPRSSDQKDVILNPAPPWEILFVDDVPTIAFEVQSLFKERLMKCHIANNAEEAFNILREDQENTITVLICDYRLIDEEGNWHKWQGYNILKEVFLNFPNELAFFALTSFNKRALIRMQDTHKMKVRSVSKDDVIGKSRTVAGFNFFADQVRDEGNKVFDFYRSQPQVSSWIKGYSKKFDKPLKTYYRLHRLAKDVDIVNHNIGLEAENFFEAIRRGKHKEEPSIDPEILGIQEGIGVDKKINLTEKAKLEKFRVKLIGRRIAIALYERLEMTKGQIYSALKSGVYRKKEPSESPNTINQFFSTFLALSLEKDIPKNLLPEEKIWLENLN